jgi:hypothetical protein
LKDDNNFPLSGCWVLLARDVFHLLYNPRILGMDTIFITTRSLFEICLVSSLQYYGSFHFITSQLRKHHWTCVRLFFIPNYVIYIIYLVHGLFVRKLNLTTSSPPLFDDSCTGGILIAFFGLFAYSRKLQREFLCAIAPSCPIVIVPKQSLFSKHFGQVYENSFFE